MILGDIEDEDRPSTRARRRAAFADRPEVPTRDAEKHMAWLDRDIIPKLLPLQKTKYGVMGVLAGHHWTQLSPVLNSVQYICNELTRLSGRKVPYMGEMSSFLDLRFAPPWANLSVRRVVHLQHGEGAGQTKTSSLLKLDRTSQGFIADAYMRAHDCQLVATKFPRLFPKEGKPGEHPDMQARDVALLNLGSATQGYNMNRDKTSYIESNMLRPTTMGWGSLHFIVRKARLFEDKSYNLRVDINIQI